MGKPAARIGDMHVCPMVTGLVPHVGGPVVGPGVPTVLIGGMPAAVSGDMCVCTGPPDTIVLGSTGVFIGGKPAARMGDMCAHGGAIVVGLPTVLIGETFAGSAAAGAPPEALAAVLKNAPGNIIRAVNQAVTMKKAANNGAPFCEKCEAAKIG
ncbi:PAAR domain-containing protein [Dyadobacter sp. CY351]|uniref:PAAR domain-containing protein n=1 Tax=Dyadobacter sp. CY351 TaxID=2909337 RepID=UPI0038D38767